ncbi:MAG: ATP-binding protein [Bacteroidetes bacterium]|nr:ATP-binding protein [Bacteroidota bacterium]
MKKITTIRLRFWLPFSIFTTFTLLLIFFSFLQFRDLLSNLEESMIISSQEKLTRMGNRIERLYNNNLNYMIGAEIADLNISNDVQSIVLVDENGIILNASQVEWEGQSIRKCLPAFNEFIFHSTQLKNRQEIQVSGDGDHIFVYEPILLETRPGEIRPMRIGLLFVDYNLSEIKSDQRSSLLVRTYTVWGIGALLMIFLYLALRFWLTRPFRLLQTIITQFGKGKYDARINIMGNGELAELGNAFNRMAEDVSNQRNELQTVLESKTQIEKELLIAKHRAEESDKLKSAFLANMSHEIRTPMNGILGFTDLLKDKNLADSDRDKFITIIHNSSHQLLMIINDIIDISKIEAGQEMINPEDINLNHTFNELFSFFHPYAEKRNLKLILYKKLPDNESFIRCDSVKLRQILTNLLGNALKFTPNGSIQFGYHIEGSNLVFYVEDTGIGVEPQLQKFIFDRFRQAETTLSRKFGGTGLGLAISKSYIEMMGGEIWVESKPGLGSRFVFTLPYYSTSSGSTITKPKADDKSLSIPNWSGKKLMLVEDIEDNAFLIKHILKPTGISVILARNGLEAIELQSINSDISLILMDMKMPEMDGYETTKRLKTVKGDLHIIATTAFALEGDCQKCLAAGCDDYLAKPIRRDELFMMIEKYM